MEDICKRFPHMAENVIKKINPRSLTQFKKASRVASNFLNNGRVLWKQIILQKNTGKYIFLAFEKV